VTCRIVDGNMTYTGWYMNWLHVELWLLIWCFRKKSDARSLRRGGCELGNFKTLTYDFITLA
jgi:hypothetical protein